MKTVIRIIVWIAYAVYAFYVLQKQIPEHGLFTIIFWIPAVVIGGAAIFALFNNMRDDEK
ncbi:MAG: hypothetical protein ISS19_18900 [Bacteroidales bacterium]|nr:hypothetical protein [Bacteroidales bacterium]